MKIILPAVLNPISRRKDKSCKLSWETRELRPDEVLSLMSLEGSEGWLMYQPNEYSSEEAQNALGTSELGRAEVSIKSPSERLRNTLYAFFKQEEKDGKFIGTFEMFYNSYIEKFRQHIISKLHD